jgi:hypothetical protein
MAYRQAVNKLNRQPSTIPDIPEHTQEYHRKETADAALAALAAMREHDERKAAAAVGMTELKMIGNNKPKSGGKLSKKRRSRAKKTIKSRKGKKSGKSVKGRKPRKSRKSRKKFGGETNRWCGGLVCFGPFGKGDSGKHAWGDSLPVRCRKCGCLEPTANEFGEYY